MNYRDSDALCLPARPPQHAAPVSFLRQRRSPAQPGFYGRLSQLTRQVLHLFITILAWATGLGLVIGSIVLIATVAAPRQTASPLKLVPQGIGSSLPGAQSGETAHPGTAARGYQVLATFSGHGNRTTAHFKVRAKLPWELRWTYNCTQRAHAKRFKVLRADMAAGRATRSTGIEEFATSGHGTAWFKPTSPRHYLVVISACSWHIKVVQAL